MVAVVRLVSGGVEDLWTWDLETIPRRGMGSL